MNSSFLVGEASCTRFCVSGITLFSGLPNAVDHLGRVSKDYKEKKYGYLAGDLIVGLIEVCPILGGLAAGIEILASRIFNSKEAKPQQERGIPLKEKEIAPLNETIAEQEPKKSQTSKNQAGLGPHELTATTHSSANSTQQDQLIYTARKGINAANGLFYPQNCFWKGPRNIPVGQAHKKMQQNLHRELTVETGKRNPSKGYATLAEIQTIEANAPKQPQKLKFSPSEHEAQGRRRTMEDAHFKKAFLNGDQLLGVFDGHAGHAVAKYASWCFEKNFERILAESNGNVHQAFETLFTVVQKQVDTGLLPLEAVTIDKETGKLYAGAEKQGDKFAKIADPGHGSTATVCFIKDGLVYTATLGDSEAHLFLDIEGKMKAIPLSRVLDWDQQGGKEEARGLAYRYHLLQRTTEGFLRAMKQPGKFLTAPPLEMQVSLDEVRKEWEKDRGYRRVGNLLVNVSRSFEYPNDSIFQVEGADGTKDEANVGILAKPKITVFPLPKLEKPAFLMVACDGMFDGKQYTEQKLIDVFAEAARTGHSEGLAEQLVDKAINEFESTDNVSAVVLRIEPAK